ncbi:hypothetical protein HELRODRAFT_97933 [Helobdella robusta]|uniref:Paraoxonase n=1 Tax=Helobdella robusta TaxID=6412 RepID=T1G9J6_HELRO|nr:hypothetical protein HELRODRAFT_97933 [Helobdella robusta]ESO09148.1 hypothetical protein HELRODRAFT_97933 [Helobdella robusta]
MYVRRLKSFSITNAEFGSEDIKVLLNGKAFVSSGLQLFGEGKKNSVGRIFLFDFKKPHEKVLKLEVLDENSREIPLTPHGMDIWVDKKSGITYLYVVNHYAGMESVEKFQFLPELKLVRVKQFRDKNFILLNGLYMINEDQFYFTNSYYFNNAVEFLLGLKWGSVGFFDGAKAELVLKGLNFPNGIIKWKNFLAVGMITSEKLNLYSIGNDHFLTLNKSIDVGSGLDNLSLDPNNGDLILGCHPSIYRVVKHSADPDAFKAPSQILRLKYKEDETTELSEIYSNDGSEVSGSSVGVLYEDGMLIGTIYTDMLYCKLDRNKKSF